MAHNLTIEPLGATICVRAGQTLLDAALRSGIAIPHACGHGLCGTCKVRVIDGTVDLGDASPFALMDFERDEGCALACCATVEDDVTIEADVEEEPDAQFIPIRDFTATVVRMADLTPTIRGIWLQLVGEHGSGPGGEQGDAENAAANPAPLHFQAGQYVSLHMPGGVGTRAFSIASPPDGTGLIELNVRRVPGGRGTAHLHDALNLGDELPLTGPYGRFFVRSGARQPMIFMAGGSGLSSPRSMILDRLAAGEDQQITLIYGQRTRDELYYHDEFVALAARHANFTYVPALSHDAPGSGWDGARGMVHDVAGALFSSDFRGHKAYLCGPPLMVEACIATLMQGRLFERDIYTERFISAADAQQIRSPLFKTI
ncbi:MAG: NADH:ubiquinone reductase (Na(+)-transporting) subunit F [Sphingopyxis sp.]